MRNQYVFVSPREPGIEASEPSASGLAGDMRTLGRGARLALVCGIWMLTSGCFLDALFSSVVISTIGEGSHTAVGLQASATLRACSVLTGTSIPLHCSYVIGCRRLDPDGRPCAHCLRPA